MPCARRLFRLLALALLVMPASRGETPAAPPAPAWEDRLNLWPLLRVEGDEVSVLAPIFYRDDERLAVRPLFSWHAGKRRLRVLYPFAEFNFTEGSWHVFPWFGGRDYQIGFPLYWDFRGQNSRTNWLLPLWSYHRQGQDWRGSALLGLLGGAEGADGRHRRVLPLFSFTRSATAFSEWVLPPFLHRWADDAGRRAGRWVLPFFFAAESADGSMWGTPLVLRWQKGGGSTQGWAVLPLAARETRPEGHSLYTPAGAYHRDGEARRWWWWPLLAWGRADAEAHSAWWLFPFYRTQADAGGWSRHLLPFFRQGAAGESRFFQSPLYLETRGAEGRRLRALPLALSWWRQGPDGWSAWALAPLAHVARAGETLTRHVFPLFYQRQAPDRSVFATLLGGRITGPDSRTDAVFPLLSWRTRAPGRTDLWIAAPLAHISRGEQAGSSHVVPLFHHDPRTGNWTSLPYVRRTDAQGRTWRVLPPLLTWWTRAADHFTLRVLGGWAGLGGLPGQRWRYVLPFYYEDPAQQTLWSPIYARWRAADGSPVHAWPLLLSGGWREVEGAPPDRASFGPLGLFGRGRDATGAWSYLFPLFGWQQGVGWWTLLAGRWQDGADTLRYHATPLVGSRSGSRQGFWLFPLLSWSRNPGVSERWRVLWGHYERVGADRESRFFPLWRAETQRVTTPQVTVETRRLNIGFLSRRFSSSQARADGHVRTQSTYRLFPLWYRSRTQEGAEVKRETSALLGLFRSRSSVSADGVQEERRRLLGNLWRYDRKGEEVHADLFPGLTYDRLADGRTRTSFLWKVFRRERDPAGQVTTTVLGLRF
jgi:hypothetical protein